MQEVRVGVVGVGYLGSLHAQKYAQMDGVKLTCVVDIDEEKRNFAAYSLGTEPFEDYREIVDKVDAVSIAVPTSLHYQVAKFFLENGKDVLVEKPLAVDISQGKELVELAKKRGAILQVGHLERFNGAFKKSLPLIEEPLFFESERIGPFRERGVDVDVILDLMIHDIDLIVSIVGKNIKEVKAVGVPVLTGEIDISQAWIEFDGGVVANVTASRVSRESVRKLRVFQKSGYISIDFLGKKATFIKKETLEYEVFSGHEVDPLFEELKSFVECVRERKRPLVSGEDGLRALEVAEMIKKEVYRRLEGYEIRRSHI